MRRFTLSFGLSLADIEVPAETLYAENRAIIDATTPRRAFVEDPVRVDITGYPEGLRSVRLANHPDQPEMGQRDVVAGPSFWLPRADLARLAGTEIRLKDLANVELPARIPGLGEEAVAARFTTRENRKLPRIQWVGLEGAVPIDLLGLEGEHRTGRGEVAMATAKPREIFQFERVGFVRVEADWDPKTTPVRVVFGHP
jgi:glutamyl/glutaminyl-tRNA synthetase